MKQNQKYSNSLCMHVPIESWTVVTGSIFVLLTTLDVVSASIIVEGFTIKVIPVQ